jgi:hypothetical protein
MESNKFNSLKSVARPQKQPNHQKKLIAIQKMTVSHCSGFHLIHHFFEIPV